VLFDYFDKQINFSNGVDFTKKFSVLGDIEIEKQPATLSKIGLDKETYQAGETVKINFGIENKSTGIKQVLVYIKGPEGNSLYGGAHYSDESKEWVGEIPLNQYVKSGEWEVEKIVLFDYFDKQINFSNGVDFVKTFSVHSIVKQLQVTGSAKGPQEIGIPITLTATSEGSNQPVYKFFVYDGKTWKVLQEYGDKDIYMWKPEKEGTYKIVVHAKDVNSKEAYNNFTAIEYKVTNGKVNKVQIATDKKGPQEIGIPITLTATSEGSNQPVYKYFVYDGKTWKVLQEYSDKNVYTWKPEEEGTYKIVVHAKGVNSKEAYDNFTAIEYKVTNGKVNKVQIATDKKGPQGIGVPITLTATSEGSKQPVYKFFAYDGKTWKVLQEYSDKNVYTWKPEKEGTYKIVVHAKDVSSKEAYENFEAMEFVVKK
ncbi:triple tyrosine motif-containing protein, partial [Bacillus wiedmannii]|uniref:triple tyrosine motif-containing protein n=1 Tax=Bacillus wiedmannii TaxID=1890302 RepID=UPI0037093A9B|nr:hypothetical protein [Bacillus wiedmannii]